MPLRSPYPDVRVPDPALSDFVLRGADQYDERDTIPKSASGKILRRVLGERERAFRSAAADALS